MKEGWKYDSFEKCLIKVPKQKAVKSKDYLAEGCFPIVSQESGLVSGYTNNAELVYKHKRPVVIFGDHTKNVKYVDFDFVVGADGVHILYPIDYINPKFLFYEICNIRLRNLGYARHYKLLKEKQIAYPSLPEQQWIVELLDAEFAKIDAIKANADKQLRAAKDLFQSALKEMLTPKEGWKTRKFGDLCLLVRGPFGGSLKKEIFVKEGYAVYEQQHAIYKNCDIRYFVSEEKYKSMLRFSIAPNDLIMSCSGTIGKIYVIPDEAPKGIINQALLKITPKCDILPNYLAHLMESDYFKNVISTYSDGAAIKNIAAVNILKEIEISIPSIEEQRNILNSIDEISEKVSQLQSNYNQTLTLCNDLKQALLKSIFE